MQLGGRGVLWRLGGVSGLALLQSQQSPTSAALAHLPKAVLDAGLLPCLVSPPALPPSTSLLPFSAVSSGLPTPLQATPGSSLVVLPNGNVASTEATRFKRSSTPKTPSHALPRQMTGAGKLGVRRGRMGGSWSAAQCAAASSPQSSSPSSSSSSETGPGQEPVKREEPPKDLFPQGKPTPEQLSHVCTRVGEWLPRFFRGTPDMTFYRQDVLLDDRIHGYQTKGIYPVWMSMVSFAAWTNIRCAYVDMKVLSVTPKLDSGTVEAHWRVQSISLLSSLGKYRKVVLEGEDPAKYSRWKDGVSVFHLDGNGLVYLHTVDDKVSDQGPPKQSLRERLLSAFAARKPMAASPC